MVTLAGHGGTVSKPHIRHNQQYQHEHIQSLTSVRDIKQVEKVNQQDKQKMPMHDDFNAIQNAPNLPMEDTQSVENYGQR